MWKNWVKEVTPNGETAYTFLLPLNIEGMKMTLELTAMIWQKSYDKLWKVIFYNAHPSSGDTTEFEGEFSTYKEAERAVWNHAQRSIDSRKKWIE